MRATWLAVALLLAVPVVVASPTMPSGAFVVSGFHASYGIVEGYLHVGEGLGGELWLSGPSLIYYHAQFVFSCGTVRVRDAAPDGDVVVRPCDGPDGRFVATYTGGGDPSQGVSVGAGRILGFQLVSDHRAT